MSAYPRLRGTNTVSFINKKPETQKGADEISISQHLCFMYRSIAIFLLNVNFYFIQILQNFYKFL